MIWILWYHLDLDRTSWNDVRMALMGLRECLLTLLFFAAGVRSSIHAPLWARNSSSSL